MIEVIWNSLLELRRLLSSCDKKNFSVQVIYTAANFHIRVGVAEAGQQQLIKFSVDDKHEYIFGWDENFSLIPLSEPNANSDYQFISTYLPYCFSTLRAHKLQRAYGISHFAQSLDGKICTLDGHSLWVTHHDDQVHCHRMRALCDSILVGINTLRFDKPQLNVHRVKGENPIKVILGSSSASFSSLMESSEKILLFTSQPAPKLVGIEQITLPDSFPAPVFVMQTLYKMGIHSVFIEGGSQTTSSFLEHRMIDEVQLYIAPVVFGSGLSNFMLPVIRDADEALVFSKPEFVPMGKGMLFKGDVSGVNQPEESVY